MRTFKALLFQVIYSRLPLVISKFVDVWNVFFLNVVQKIHIALSNNNFYIFVFGFIRICENDYTNNFNKTKNAFLMLKKLRRVMDQASAG